MIVILEGIDNCGKNTIAKLLLAKHKDIFLIEFPDYNTEYGEFIKKQLKNVELSPLSMQLLFSSERLSKADVIREKSRNSIVITTRYTYSALVYGQVRGINVQLLRMLESTMPVPDKKIYLKITAEESMKRSIESDLFESNFSFLKQAERIYDEIISKEQGWCCVDASKAIENVFNQVEEIIFPKVKNEMED